MKIPARLLDRRRDPRHIGRLELRRHQPLLMRGLRRRDLVANISPAWITELAPDWVRILKPDGIGILSG